MLAKFVKDLLNEASKENTKSWKLLKWLGEQPNGATFTEIQHYIYTVLNGNSEEDFWEKDSREKGYVSSLRTTRGYWNINLFGNGHKGLLNNFCEKVGKKWVLKRMPEEDELLYEPTTISKFRLYSPSTGRRY